MTSAVKQHRDMRSSTRAVRRSSGEDVVRASSVTRLMAFVVRRRLLLAHRDLPGSSARLWQVAWLVSAADQLSGGRLQHHQRPWGSPHATAHANTHII